MKPKKDLFSQILSLAENRASCLEYLQGIVQRGWLSRF